jgi:hypothetical protein
MTAGAVSPSMRVERDEKSCAGEVSAVEPMPASVTVNAKRNQIIRCIMTEFTPRLFMMDFQHSC